jgi:hypothetical protein
MRKKQRFVSKTPSQGANVKRSIASFLALAGFVLLSSGLISGIRTWLFMSRAASAVGEVVHMRESVDHQMRKTFRGSKIVEKKYWVPEIRFQSIDGSAVKFDGPKTYQRPFVRPTVMPLKISPGFIPAQTNSRRTFSETGKRISIPSPSPMPVATSNNPAPSPSLSNVQRSGVVLAVVAITLRISSRRAIARTSLV